MITRILISLGKELLFAFGIFIVLTILVGFGLIGLAYFGPIGCLAFLCLALGIIIAIGFIFEDFLL